MPSGLGARAQEELTSRFILDAYQKFSSEAKAIGSLKSNVLLGLNDGMAP